MKIQYMSDIHLEFSDNARYIKNMEIEPAGDVLVLAGDSFYLNDTTTPNRRIWGSLSQKFKQVLLVPGNHEFYNNGDVTKYGESWEKRIRENVRYYQNKVVRIDDTDFILSTLWSDIPPKDEYIISRGMNDFRQILYNGKRFTTADYVTEHRKCLEFIRESVENSTADKIVVVTHHLPTYAVIAPWYKGDTLNGAFATELGEWIANTRINAWIFGHSHTNIDTLIGDTQIVSNQMGYVGYGGISKGFDPNKVVEV